MKHHEHTVAAFAGRALLVLSAIGTVACGEAPDDSLDIGDEALDLDIATVQQEILNGDPLTLTETAIVFGDALGGFVALGHSPSGTESVFCSGTLLTNNVVITAKHCLQAGTTSYLVNSPVRLRVTMGRNSFPQTRYGQSIHFHSAHDLAMIVVSSNFVMANPQGTALSSTGYSRPFFTGGGASVDGSFLACFGHGRNVETCAPNDPNDCTGSGVGQLRMALLQANYEAFSPPFYRFYPNNNNQLMARGDSGGSCVEPVVSVVGRPDRAQIISVHSRAFPATFANGTPIELMFEPGWSQVSP